MNLQTDGFSEAHRSELAQIADCRRLVGAFYARVRRDPLLAPLFAARIDDPAWPEHLERMAGFWYTVLFGEPLYHGDPVARHRGLPVSREHFDRWLALWCTTLDELFTGVTAERAKRRAERMAEVLLARVSR